MVASRASGAAEELDQYQFDASVRAARDLLTGKGPPPAASVRATCWNRRRETEVIEEEMALLRDYGRTSRGDQVASAARPMDRPAQDGTQAANQRRRQEIVAAMARRKAMPSGVEEKRITWDTIREVLVEAFVSGEWMSAAEVASKLLGKEVTLRDWPAIKAAGILGSSINGGLVTSRTRSREDAGGRGRTPTEFALTSAFTAAAAPEKSVAAAIEGGSAEKPPAPPKPRERKVASKPAQRTVPVAALDESSASALLQFTATIEAAVTRQVKLRVAELLRKQADSLEAEAGGTP